MNLLRFRILFPVLAFGAVGFPVEAPATTKGLSQIVTPDLQKPGDLSVSYQHQGAAIGNTDEIQAELGLTSWAEIAVFEGLQPSETIFAAELGLVQKGPWLLSTGLLNFSTRSGAPSPQPFLEAGYYLEHAKPILGVIYANSKAEVVAGFAYDFDSHWRAQVDFQGGDENFYTAGFTYSLNERFQFNPAIYFPNSPSVNGISGYAVFTYTASWF